jgi:acetyl-CoA/propionyl-CoA carboxylase, biotin carboxylase, biotin carboxyl carrier protein
VAEMFRIAEGEPIGYDDPPARGHSIEFRINAEDPGRNFLPTPGTIASMRPASGPGVRLDSGYQAGMTVPRVFDSLIAKLIVTGRDRRQALARSRRALAEFEIGGLPTVLPFHRAAVSDPAFTSEPFSVHTRWIETEFAGDLPPYSGDSADGGAEAERERITVEVGGKRLEVVLPAGLVAGGGSAAAQPGRARPPAGRSRERKQASAASGDDLVSPMQGTIAKIVVEEGQQVKAGGTVVVLEAMKMEQPLTAHKDGTVTGLSVEIGQTVPAGTVICQLKD